MARSIKAFLKAMEAALTASALMGPVTTWSINSLGIRGRAADLAAMAAFFNFVLLGINAPIGHVMPQTQNSGQARSFGYKGLHMDLALNATRRDLPEYAAYAPFRFELQVRTIIQDSWSVLDHKIKYKKSIPNQLKRRINVLSALFELADREFRQIRDSTEVELRRAPDETANERAEVGPQQPAIESGAGADLNAFTFLKIASHFFRNFEFEPHKVDGFVHNINELSPDITRSKFNFFMRQNIARVKRYKQFFEERSATDKFNPYTVMRHCLYLGDTELFSRA